MLSKCVNKTMVLLTW